MIVLQVSNPKKVEWDFGDPGNSFEQTIHIHNEDYSKMISKMLLYLCAYNKDVTSLFCTVI